MAYTTTKNPTTGLYEIFKDGQRVATGSAGILSQYGLSETSAPTLPATNPINAPTPSLSLPSTPSDTTLPHTGTSGLLGFKDAVAKTLELARQKRDDLMSQFMLPQQGTLAASDFTTLFNAMSRSSDTFAEQKVKELFPADTAKPQGDIAEFQQAKKLGLIGEKTDFFDYLKKKKEATTTPPDDPLKTASYTWANNLLKLNSKADFAELRNNILQHTNLSSTEVDTFLAANGKTAKTEIPPPPDYVKTATSYKEAGWTRDQIEKQYTDAGKTVPNDFNSALDNVFGKKKHWYNF